MRSVKVSVCLACCDCCLVMRSIVKTGGYSGIGPSGQPAARLSWRLFSFMYDAWGSSVARGEVPPRLSGVSAPGGGSGGHVGEPIYQGG